MAVSINSQALRGPQIISDAEGGKRYLLKLGFTTEGVDLEEVVNDEPLDVEETEMLITFRVRSNPTGQAQSHSRNVEMKCPKLRSVRVRFLDENNRVQADAHMLEGQSAGSISDNEEIHARHIYHPDPSPIRDNS